MRKTLNIVSILALLFFVSGCKQKNEETKIVQISTKLGKIKIKLYEETPKHRNNFIKLIESGGYNGLLFHRVIKNFMIQGGDPDSKYAKKDERLGNGDLGYKIPAEFNVKYFHKKGALAAARKSSNDNPNLESSASQFYIVQGKTWTDLELENQETRVNNMKKKDLFSKYFMQLQDKQLGEKDPISNQEIAKLANKLVDEQIKKEGLYIIPEEHKKFYKTIGGTPHLDGSYTVFGEVIEGLEVIDKIANVETDKFNRPIEDIEMKIKIIK